MMKKNIIGALAFFLIMGAMILQVIYPTFSFSDKNVVYKNLIITIIMVTMSLIFITIYTKGRNADSKKLNKKMGTNAFN